MKTTEIVLAEKRQSFTNISLTVNTICDRILDLAADIDIHKRKKIASVVALSVVMDKSTDITDIAQLAHPWS